MDAVAEIADLRAQLAEREAELAMARAELTGAQHLIEQYKAQLHKLRRMKFGRSSEAIDAQIHQLELRLEDLEESEAARIAAAKDKAPGKPHPERRQPVRRRYQSISRARRSFMRRVRFAPAAVADISQN